jgi:3'(2'), 5'-bisphosphate nucleotidase
VAAVLAAAGKRGLKTREPARLDSQCKYAVVARGQADAYLRLPTKKGYVERIWDHAAGALIAAEAGVAVTDAVGHDLDFSQGRGLEKNRGILAAPARPHGLLLAAIKELGAA